MKVVLYVMNDLSHDSRVIREARTLAAAGHHVTVMTTSSGEPTGTRIARDGYEIIRIAEIGRASCRERV